jgi:endo-alpha-1,4-polygalactosaminidase (GH114 family)
LHHAGSYWYEHWSEAAKKKKREIRSKETDGVLYVSSSVMQWGPDMTVHSAANTNTHHRAHIYEHTQPS